MGWKWMKYAPGYVLARARVRSCGRSRRSEASKNTFNCFFKPISKTAWPEQLNQLPLRHQQPRRSY